MEVILLEKIHKLGNLGEKVRVKSGYGRNYLVPHGKAIFATEKNIAEFEARRGKLEAKAEEKLSAAQTRADSLSKLNISITAKASEEGKLYGSVGTAAIAKAITGAGVELKKSEVLLPEGTLHHVGEYEVALQLHSDLETKVKINIIPEA